MRFWRSVPPVTISLKSAPGLVAAIGIGEAPIGLQGTFSLWESAAAIRDFAYKGAAHQKAIADTSAYKWYSEELFARFAVHEMKSVQVLHETLMSKFCASASQQMKYQTSQNRQPMQSIPTAARNLADIPKYFHGTEEGLVEHIGITRSSRGSSIPFNCSSVLCFRMVVLKKGRFEE